MGIDLGDVVVRHAARMQDFAGKRFAFDAWNILYQFLASIRLRDGSLLTDAQGNVTSHLTGILTRVGNLVEAGVKPVFVFDGPPHPLKSETLAQRSARKEKAEAERAAAAAAGDEETARSKAAQTSRLTPPMVSSAMELLHALGIPTVQAPQEGEAQASWMAAHGLVDGVVSQDYDALLFGAPLLVRHLGVGSRRKLPGKQVWVDATPERILLDECLAHAGCADCATKMPEAPGTSAHVPLSREQLVDVALLVGTDFHPGIRGIGARRAVDLIRKDGSLEVLLDRLTAKGAGTAAERAIVEQGEALAYREDVRRLFLEPAHTPDVPGLALRPPDASRVHELLIGRHGFERERVDAALQKFGKSKASQTRLF